MGNLGSIPGLGRYRGEGKGYPLQYSDLENSMHCIVHGVAKSQTQLSNFHLSHNASLPPLFNSVGHLLFSPWSHVRKIVSITKIIRYMWVLIINIHWEIRKITNVYPYCTCLTNPMDRGACQAMESQGIRHDWSNLACTHSYCMSKCWG